MGDANNNAPADSDRASPTRARRPAKRRWSLWAMLAMLVVLGAGVTYLHSSSFRNLIERRLETVLAERTGRDCRLRLVSLRPFSLRARVMELRIAGRGAEGPAFLELDEGFVDARWRPMLSRRLGVSELRLDGLRIDLSEMPSPATDREPAPPPSLADLMEPAVIDHGVLERGRIRFGAHEAPVQVEAAGIRVNLDGSTDPERYRVHVSIEDGTVLLPPMEDLAVAVAAEAGLDARTLALHELRLRGAGIDLRLNASLDDLAAASGAANVDLEAELGELPLPSVDGTKLQGAVRATGSGRFSGTGFRIEVAASAERIAWGDWVAENLRLHLAGTERDWRSEFDLAAFGVEFRGTLNGGAVPGLTPIAARISWSSPDLGALAVAWAEKGVPRLRGVLTGRLDAQADSLDPTAVRATFEMETIGLGPRDAPEVSITTRLAGSLAGATLTLHSVDARGAGFALEARGRAALDEQSDLRLVLSIDDLPRTVRFTRALLGSLGIKPGFRGPPDGSGGSLSLTGAFRSPGLAAMRLEDVEADFALTARGVTLAGPAGFPIDASGTLRLDRGRWELRAADLRGPGASATLSGAFHAGGKLDGSLHFAADEIGSFASRLARESQAAGLPDSALRILTRYSGAATLDAEVRGPWRTLDGRVGVTAEKFGVREGAPGRKVRLETVLRGGTIEGTARIEGDAAWLNVELRTAPYMERPFHGTLEASLVETAPEWWAELSGLDFPVRGRLEAAGNLDLRTLTGTFRAEIVDGEFRGQPFELSARDVVFSPQRIEVPGAEIRALGGATQFAGVLGGPAGASELRVTAERISLSEVVRAVGGTQAAGGTLRIEATVRGTPGSPEVQAQLTTDGLTLEGRRLADLRGAVTYAGDTLLANLEEPGGAGRIGASLRIGEPLVWRLNVHYPLKLDLNRLAGASSGAPRFEFDGVLLADLEGSGTEASALGGRLELPGSVLRMGDESFVARDGPVIDLEAGVARVAPFRITGAGLTVRASGEIGLDPAFPVTASFAGQLPLRPFSERLPRSRLDGVLSFDAHVGGTLRQPEWSGTVSVQEGRIANPVLPAPLQHVAARLSLDPDTWRIDELSMQVGGGRVRGTGEYVPAGERAGQLHIALAGESVRMPLIEGLRSEFDATLAIDGRVGETLTLSGRVELARAAYVRNIEIQKELLARVRAVTTGSELGGALDRLRLDLQLDAVESLHVQNNLASVRTSASLQVGGTAADPRVTGQVELLEGGRVFFRGVTYGVTRGTLDYVSDPPENPALDIEAQATVSSYDITLRASGSLENPAVELTSSPPLPQADIVSLLLTGRTREEVGHSGGGLSDTQAALYLSNNYTKEIEQRLARSLGLDQVTIDPVLVAGETDPAARVTLGKALTGRTSATYSRALGGSDADIYELRFQPLQRFSLVGRRDEEGELSADVHYGQRLYLGPPRATDRPGGAEAERRILRVTFSGQREFGERRLRRDLGLRAGDRFRRPVLLAGLDAIRDRYLGRGYPEAHVDADVTEETGGVAVRVHIEEGRRASVRIEGVQRRRLLKSEVLELWRDSVFPDEIAEDASELVRKRLAGRGYLAARVEAELEPAAGGSARLLLEVAPGMRVKLDEIVLEGNELVDSKRLRAQMLSEEDRLFTSGWLSKVLLDEDREAILGLYRSLGFLEASIGDPEISYPRREGRALVSVPITEGRRFSIGTVVFSGPLTFEEPLLAKTAALRPGGPYLDALVRAARSSLRVFYDRNGHPEARIDVRTVVDLAAARVDVEFAIAEGPHKTVESVEIAGAGVTRPGVILREVEVSSGQPLSADRVAATRQNLYRTGLFRSVSVVEAPGETSADRRLTVVVEEKANLRTDYGLGYSTDRGVRASAVLTHTNLWGRRLEGSLGARVSQIDWRVWGLARQPRLFGSHLQGLASTFLEREEKEAFAVRRVGSTVQLDSKPTNRRFRWFVGYGLQAVDLFQEALEIPPGSELPPEVADLIDPRTESTLRLGNLNAGTVIGARDDFAWPTRGSVLQATIAAFDSALLSEAEFLRATAQWSVHRRLGSRTIWGLGFRCGLAEPYGGTEFVPLSERFFAGGDSSIRGFKRDSLVPLGFPVEELVATGVTVEDSLGGNALFIANQELVLPLVEPLAAVLFHDAGNVYWDSADIDLTRLRHAAGLGLRIRTPVGPVRLEYGWKLNRRADESRGRLHFSIGVPF